MVEAFNGRAPNYADDHIANGFVYEDPMQRFEGKKEFSFMLTQASPKFLHSLEYELLSEHHSKSQSLFDAKLTTRFQIYPSFSLVSPMRTVFTFKQEGGVEKIVRCEDQWFGNKIIQEDY